MKNINKELRLIQCIWTIGLLSFSYMGFFIVAPVALADSFTFTRIDFPGAKGTAANGIADNGSIVGIYFKINNGGNFGFRRSCRGNFTKIRVRGEDFTDAKGIANNGAIIGDYGDFDPNVDHTHGFLRHKGIFTQIDFPGADLTEAHGIANNNGSIVGRYFSSQNHGFLLSNGVFTTIDFPGATQTFAQGISDNGSIVGGYFDSRGEHGFVASPSSLSFPNLCK